MHISEVLKKLTPGPWILVDPRHQGKSVRVEGALLPDRNARPVICELGDPNWRANAGLIVAAPELLIDLYLALHALKQPELKKAALVRGQAVLARVIGSHQLQPDQQVLTELSAFGVIEPALTELALTTTPALAEGWIRYAQDQGLGTGFVVTQLRTGRQPPFEPPSKSWYTDQERQLFIVT